MRAMILRHVIWAAAIVLLLAACASTRPPAMARSGQRCSRQEDCGLAFRCEGLVERESRYVPNSGTCEEVGCHERHGALASRQCAAAMECVCDDGFCLQHDLGSCAATEPAPEPP